MKSKSSHSFIISILLLHIVVLSMSSCGPRSGINHNENEVESNTNIKVDTTSPTYLQKIAAIKTFERGKKLFKQNCAVCHAARESNCKVGEGLDNLQQRLPKPSDDWFINYVLNSDSMAKSGDPYAKALKSTYKGSSMPSFYGQLTKIQIQEIYIYLIAPPQHNGCLIE